MSNFPSTIKWGFDPRSSAIPALSTERGRLVWGAIRSCHIVDQHFNDACASFVERISQQMPETAESLYSAAYAHGLGMFGLRVNESLWWTGGRAGPDLEWWGAMLDVLTGKASIAEEFPHKENASDSNR